MKNLLLALLLAGAGYAAQSPATLDQDFLHPPPSARPWVYWFWLNGNITSNGITADLEAMQRAGIGGVLIMEVDQGAPKGPAPFASPPWRQLFKHVCAEATRLGLEVNMNNDAGWCGSGGPWISPDLAMQKLVWTETQVEGPCRLDYPLPQPATVANYYRDIAVLAFPAPAGKARIGGIEAKAAFQPVPVTSHAAYPAVPADQTIARERILDLTCRLDARGQLTWEVPAGKWTILRLGHTPTGKDNHPAPEAGRGLECDKLSRAGAEAMFAGLMGKLVADNQPGSAFVVPALAGGPGSGQPDRLKPGLPTGSLVATHIDSWEVGSQNWTPRFRDEFRARRGYDPLPFLAVVTGRVVGSAEVSERFLWDLRQTISELVLENYAGCFRDLARRHGLRLSIEAYTTCPTAELEYAGRADEPMGEFWSWGKYGAAFSCTEMASAAHVYGKRIVGAEAFTAADGERWLGHPGDIKDLGDWAFCEGINRFVFHRYALQPWTDPPRAPGMSMGPWGLHYERTETWWEQSRPWHEYLARCQYLLRQGLFVADICLLSPEGSPQTLDRQKSFQSPSNPGLPFERPGHNFDVCPPEVLLTRMSVKNGRLVLPDGMSYRLLALPQSETMTPQLLAKIKELVRAGATVVGARPLSSPSLSGYPACDAQVKALADELWGPNDVAADGAQSSSAAQISKPHRAEQALCAPGDVIERAYGKGRLICGSRFDHARDLDRDNAGSRLGTAKWIWFKEGNPAHAAPVGPRYFRRTVQVAPDARLDAAHLVMTADNSFQCWVNGRLAGSGDDFTRTYDLNVTALLKPGDNLIAVTAVNGADQPNPAGLIASLTLKYKDGRSVAMRSDGSWEAARTVQGAWQSEVAQANPWRPAMELGPLGMAPWGDIEHNAASGDLYPDLEFLGQLLTERGLPPDFAYKTKDDSQSLRYIHRAAGQTDIYFVANKTPRPQAALCWFRVRGKRPELWHPDSGQIERPAAYNEAAGGLSLPLVFEPNGSVFVVFRQAGLEPNRIVSVSCNAKSVLDLVGDPAKRSARSVPAGLDDGGLKLTRDSQGQLTALVSQPGRYALQPLAGNPSHFNVPSLPAPLEVAGPWQVQFAPGGGAPAQVTFNKLISWSDHADPGVKYFSGAGTYTTTFTAPAEMLEQEQRLFLDLGKVEIIAEVTLNGKPLGTLWRPPFRVEVTGALQPGRNTLAVKVVNLWINRQIGDEQLPEDSERNPNGTLKQWPAWLQHGQPNPSGRFTFTSWRLWKKDSPLQPSGLLGPVTLSAAKEITLDNP